jgi:L-iditol 2-dehydrogenase
VAIEPGVTCGRCRFCKSGRYNLCPNVVFYATPPVHGAMAEYAVIRADFAHPIPDAMSYEQAALVEPISVGMHAARLADVQPGKTTLVCGAGPIGLLAAAAARHAGAEQVVISDVYPRRLETALRVGATCAVDVRTEDLAAVISRLTDGEGADALLDTSGNRSVLEAAPDLMARAGTIAVIGLPEDDAVTYRMNRVVDKELAIRGVFRYANTYPAGVGLVASGQYPVEAVITHCLPLDAAVEALDLVMRQKDRAIKVMVTP